MIREAGSTGNLFLDTLPKVSAQCLLERLEWLPMEAGTPIAEIGTAIEQIYFPTLGFISTVTNMRSGASIEVMLTGRDGFYGLPVVLGTFESSSEAMVQITDVVLRMTTADFLACYRADAKLRERSLLYAQTMFTTIAQLSGCNRLHPVDGRCARWLLMAHDRVPGDELLLTHDYLATMLGVRRAAVSLAAAALEQAGLIDYHRGRILVLDRHGLEAAACECYTVINDDCFRVLGYTVRKTPVEVFR